MVVGSGRGRSDLVQQARDMGFLLCQGRISCSQTRSVRGLRGGCEPGAQSGASLVLPSASAALPLPGVGRIAADLGVATLLARPRSACTVPLPAIPPRRDRGHGEGGSRRIGLRRSSSAPLSGGRLAELACARRRAAAGNHIPRQDLIESIVGPGGAGAAGSSNGPYGRLRQPCVRPREAAGNAANIAADDVGPTSAL